MDRREFMKAIAIAGVVAVGGLTFGKQPSVRWEGCNDQAFRTPSPIEVDEKDGIAILVPPLKYGYIRFVCDSPQADPSIILRLPHQRRGIFPGWRMTKRDMVCIDKRLLTT